MPRSSRIAAALLAGLYAAFWLWWGGNGEPLSLAETQAYLEGLKARFKVEIRAPVAPAAGAER